jgi:hypothetical protein
MSAQSAPSSAAAYVRFAAFLGHREMSDLSLQSIAFAELCGYLVNVLAAKW